MGRRRKQLRQLASANHWRLQRACWLNSKGWSRDAFEDITDLCKDVIKE